METRYIVFQKAEGKRPGPLEILKGRMKGGAPCETLINNLQIALACPGRESLHELARAMVYYCFGWRAMRRVFPHEYNTVSACRLHPERGQHLYHWTAAENVDSIRKNGLVPREASGCIYLTDQPSYVVRHGLLQWKTRQYKRDVCYALLRVRADELSREQEIRRLFLAHEFVVKSVPPQFIEDRE